MKSVSSVTFKEEFKYLQYSRYFCVLKKTIQQISLIHQVSFRMYLLTYILVYLSILFAPKAGAVNNQSRPQSHSSGEFSLLHDHETWSSSSSSPIQYLKSHTRSSPVLHHKISESLDRRGTRRIMTNSPGSEVVTLQQFLEESNKDTSNEVS